MGKKGTRRLPGSKSEGCSVVSERHILGVDKESRKNRDGLRGDIRDEIEQPWVHTSRPSTKRVRVR